MTSSKRTCPATPGRRRSTRSSRSYHVDPRRLPPMRRPWCAPSPRPPGRSSSRAVASTSPAPMTPCASSRSGTGIPVATSNSGKGSIAETHDLAPEQRGALLAQPTRTRPSRTPTRRPSRRDGARAWSPTRIGWSRGTRVIHVSIDPDVIGMNFPTELGLVADARTFLEAVLDRHPAGSAALPGHRRARCQPRARARRVARAAPGWRPRVASTAARCGRAIMAARSIGVSPTTRCSSPTRAIRPPGPVPSRRSRKPVVTSCGPMARWDGLPGGAGRPARGARSAGRVHHR